MTGPRVLLNLGNLRSGGGLQVGASFLDEVAGWRERRRRQERWPWLATDTVVEASPEVIANSTADLDGVDGAGRRREPLVGRAPRAWQRATVRRHLHRSSAPTTRVVEALGGSSASRMSPAPAPTRRCLRAELSEEREPVRRQVSRKAVSGGRQDRGRVTAHGRRASDPVGRVRTDLGGPQRRQRRLPRRGRSRGRDAARGRLTPCSSSRPVRTATRTCRSSEPVGRELVPPARPPGRLRAHADRRGVGGAPGGDQGVLRQRRAAPGQPAAEGLPRRGRRDLPQSPGEPVRHSPGGAGARGARCWPRTGPSSAASSATPRGTSTRATRSPQPTRCTVS